MVFFFALAALYSSVGRATFDQLIEDGEHHHHQVLAISKKHPKGVSWAERWMAKG